jgi:hypothetical protein
MAYQDSKFSFSIDGIKYSDIKGQHESSYDKIYIRVSGTAQMIRQWMKAKYPQIPLSNYFWIKSRSFANGNAIDIYLNDAPDNIYNELNSELSDKFEYGSYHYGAKQGGGGIRSKTDEGKSIDYGTKYLHVSNNQPYGANSPTVDWNIINNPVSAKTTKQFQSKSTKSTFDKGDFLMDCAGWEIYKKKYADGKILYTAHKKLTTPNNKVDWNTIKGEIYTETGFSYSRFGNFQKWGQIASEAYVINLLCQILGKYYKDPTMASQPVQVSQPQQNLGLNESYKSLPPNPKLEFCAINRAEGSYPDDTFPIQFQSFTALTKFIADNIGEMPKAGEGYDKYFISFKWKFEDDEDSDRYDVSEDGENPYKYSNLWAFDSLRMLCYNAWRIDGQSAQSYSFNDEFYANEIGREGWEINSVQFMSLLSAIIGLYPEDKTKFDYNTYTERFDRFASVYPQLYSIFSIVITNATKSKEDIQKAIKGLQYLADKGNDKAIKAIKGLEYLLNK